ncbi:MAG TPA: hypothetical protein VN906_05140 [Candidatus Sulfotelmatobacter sp.]|nr:hypothetical protein [Candidatus Sulfotelmatobacter sp.]
MKLQRLAGYGPTAAYVSALSLFVFFFILILAYPISQAAPGLATVLTVIWFFALWLWIGAFAVVVFDLEWLEHPATSTRWFQIAHWATLVAVWVPVLLGLSLIFNTGFLGALCVLVIGICVGTSLLVHNLDARRAGLLKGNLPWVGVVAGVAFILAAIGIAISLPPLGFTALILGETFYIAWAIWLGVKLGGAKTATPTPASATR